MYSYFSVLIRNYVFSYIYVAYKYISDANIDCIFFT